MPDDVFADRWFTFSDPGRRLHVDVADAAPGVGVLDGLHVDRSYSRP